MSAPYATVGRFGQYHTGLLVPESRPLSTPSFAESVGVLPRSEIEQLIYDPKRVSGRTLFGEKYMKHQRNRGSCNGFAGAKALERSRVLQGMEWVALSGEGLYAQINGGVDRGSGLQEGMDAMIGNGVPPEDMVPSQEYLWRNISEEAKRAMARFKAAECYRVDIEDELATGLALGFVGVVAVHATAQFQRLDKNGIVYPANGVGNHAVGVDDVNIVEGEFVFDMFNSWGLGYGHKGRGFLTWRRHFTGPIKHHAFYLIRAATRDPQGVNPPIPGGSDEDGSDNVPDSGVSITMGTRDNCGWCRKWKKEVLPKVRQAGITFQERVMSGRVPQFDVFLGGRSHTQVDYMDFEEVMQVVDKLRRLQ